MHRARSSRLGRSTPLPEPTCHYLDPPAIMSSRASGGAIAAITGVLVASVIGLAYLVGIKPGAMTTKAGLRLPTAPAREPVREVTVPIAVTASEFQLSPRTLSVSEPGVITIALSNRDPVDHNLSIEGVNGLLSVPASGRGVASFRLEAPGTYQITCAVPNHVEAGMSAMIIVGEPPPTGSAGD